MIERLRRMFAVRRAAPPAPIPAPSITDELASERTRAIARAARHRTIVRAADDLLNDYRRQDALTRRRS